MERLLKILEREVLGNLDPDGPLVGELQKDRTVNGSFASFASVRSSPQPCSLPQAGEGALPLSLKKPKKGS